jgi:hypothetical protein
MLPPKTLPKGRIPLVKGGLWYRVREGECSSEATEPESLAKQRQQASKAAKTKDA